MIWVKAIEHWKEDPKQKNNNYQHTERKYSRSSELQRDKAHYIFVCLGGTVQEGWCVLSMLCNNENSNTFLTATLCVKDMKTKSLATHLFSQT